MKSNSLRSFYAENNYAKESIYQNQDQLKCTRIIQGISSSIIIERNKLKIDRGFGVFGNKFKVSSEMLHRTLSIDKITHISRGNHESCISKRCFQTGKLRILKTEILSHSLSTKYPNR